jgi:predicted flap endonuclease-1-like 5' DNA nuclease
MSVAIDKIRGITKPLVDGLRSVGIRTSGQLLQNAATPLQRKTLANKLGVEPSVILNLANRADLARVNGIGGVYSDLLEHSGVDTIRELAQRRADNLYRRMQEINDARQLAKMLPSEDTVYSWVAQARNMHKLLEY